MSLQSSLDRFRTLSYQPEPGTSRIISSGLHQQLVVANELPPPMIYRQEKKQLVSRIINVLDGQNVEFSTAFSCTVGRERISFSLNM